MLRKAILLYLVKPKAIGIDYRVFNNIVKFYANKNKKTLFYELNLKKNLTLVKRTTTHKK